MDNQIKVITFTPFKLDANKGVFRVKAPSTMNGVKLLPTKDPNKPPTDTKPYLIVDNVRGKLRWADIYTTDYGANFIVYLEGQGGKLFGIKQTAEPTNLSDLLNPLLSVFNTGSYLEESISVSYWVRPSTKDPNKTKGTLNIYGIKGFYSKEKPMPEETKWKKVVIGGKEQYDSNEYIKFWQKYILALQVMLINRGDAIPVNTQNSILSGEMHNPLEIKQPIDVRMRVKETQSKFGFMWFGENGFSGGGQISSDDIDYSETPTIVTAPQPENAEKTISHSVPQLQVQPITEQLYSTPMTVSNVVDEDPDDLPF